MSKKKLPTLSKTAFWSGSVPKNEILLYQWKNGIIINVFENGTFDDMIKLLVFYGRNNVIDILKKAVPLRNRTINLCCSIFNLKPRNFKCHKENRLRPF